MCRILQAAFIAVTCLLASGCGSEDILPPTPLKYYTITGRVTAHDVDIANIVISNGSRWAIPDVRGNYIIDSILNGTYTITVSKEGLSFVPEMRQVIVNSANATGVDFDTYPVLLMEMVSIPGGTFMMGSNLSSDTKPAHMVTLRGFLIGKFEVTQEMWKEVMGQNPSNFPGDKNPVERVTWYDAVTFCNAISQRHKLTPAYTISGNNVTCDFEANGYRLPTEAEWEYACRAGTTSEQYSSPVSELAWYKGNSGNTTHPVGQKRPNTFGLHDMYGNVFEWCWNWRELYDSTAKSDPKGPANGAWKMLRGGSWFFDAGAQSSTFRLAYEPDVQFDGIGFRVARSVR